MSKFKSVRVYIGILEDNYWWGRDILDKTNVVIVAKLNLNLWLSKGEYNFMQSEKGAYLTCYSDIHIFMIQYISILFNLILFYIYIF